MLRLPINYKDFNGKEQTDVFYFHISEEEIVTLEARNGGNLKERFERIVEAEDYETLVEEFKNFILLAIGEKSEDGKSFVKNEEIRQKFKSHAAYNALFVKLASDSDFAATYIEGVFPKDLPQDKPASPPSVPNLPPPPIS